MARDEILKTKVYLQTALLAMARKAATQMHMLKLCSMRVVRCSDKFLASPCPRQDNFRMPQWPTFMTSHGKACTAPLRHESNATWFMQYLNMLAAVAGQVGQSCGEDSSWRALQSVFLQSAA